MTVSTRPASVGKPAASTGPALLRELVHATYWLDDGLQAYMKEHAGISLPRAQSMMMVYIAEGVDSPTDLARRLRVSKQAIRQGLKELMAKDMVTVEPDPANRRQKVVRFTEHGRALRQVAREGLQNLESELGRRLGEDRLAALHDALFADWGDVPEEP